ncbi:hypothetical protein FS749_011138 [Ceratobasidium sp. UAMH 11750]|nr:hypothetical protein FS749_011138 [Ceratobasidium sp. UAMH 11750]
MDQNSSAIELGTLGSQHLSKSQLVDELTNDGMSRAANSSGVATYNFSGNDTATERQLVELAPMDKGFAAWSFVASAFILDTLVWGFGYTYGVFQEYFIRQRTFKDASEAAIGSVGTIALAIEYFAAMFVILAAQQWRHKIPVMMWTCLGICCLSLVCASFATQIWHLIILQGVGFGIGGGGVYAPIVVYLSEWFSVRKGLACAIIFCGAGAGGMIYPILVNYLLEGLGFRWALRIWAAYVLASGSLSLIFMKPRLPLIRPPATQNMGLLASIKRQHWSFLYSPLFIAISGGFSSIWPAACSDIVGPDNQTTVSNVFGVFGMVKGIAAVIGPIVAASLHHPHDSAVRTVYSGYGFRDVTLFVGSMMAATAAGGVGAKYLARK